VSGAREETWGKGGREKGGKQEGRDKTFSNEMRNWKFPKAIFMLELVIPHDSGYSKNVYIFFG